MTFGEMLLIIIITTSLLEEKYLPFSFQLPFSIYNHVTAYNLIGKLTFYWWS